MSQLLFSTYMPYNPAIESVHKVIEGQIAHSGSVQLLRIGHQFDERESPTQGSVEKLNAPVRGIHRSENEDVRGNDERFLTLWQGDRQPAFVPFENGAELAKHFRDVSAIELIDNQ